jgi:hypothetical protein
MYQQYFKTTSKPNSDEYKVCAKGCKDNTQNISPLPDQCGMLALLGRAGLPRPGPWIILLN